VDTLVLSSAQSSPMAVVAKSDNNKARPRLRLRSLKVTNFLRLVSAASLMLGRRVDILLNVTCCLKSASVLTPSNARRRAFRARWRV